MALTVLFVSGPRRCGKSTFIQQFVTDCFRRPPHYLRLAAASGDKRPPIDAAAPNHDCGVASAQWVRYEPDRVFEFLPAALSKIHKQDRKGVVVIEADADPLLRHAYPSMPKITLSGMPIIDSCFRDFRWYNG